LYVFLFLARAPFPPLFFSRFFDGQDWFIPGLGPGYFFFNTFHLLRIQKFDAPLFSQCYRCETPMFPPRGFVFLVWFFLFPFRHIRVPSAPPPSLRVEKGGGFKPPIPPTSTLLSAPTIPGGLRWDLISFPLSRLV